MNKIASVILLFILCSPGIRAQKVSFSRSIGTKSIGLSGSLLPGSYGAKLQIERKIGYPFNLIISGNYYRGQSGFSRFRSYTLESTCNYEIFRVSNNFITSLGASLFMGMEDIRSSVEDKEKQILTAGAGSSLKTDIYLSRRICLFIEGSLNKNFKSEIYKSFAMLNAGLKIVIL